MMEFALFGAGCMGFVLGVLLVAFLCREIEKENNAQADDEPQRWFVRFAYRRTFFGDWRKPTQWFHTYRILEADDADKLYEMVRKSLLYPSSKDSVEIRILDIHEI